MPKSYFTKYANSTLNYKLPTGTLVTNPVTGNVEEQTITHTASAILEFKNNVTRNEPGLDESEVKVDGYLVNPMQFPVGLVVPHIMDAEIGGVKGQLSLVETIASPWGEEKLLGKYIQGTFRVVGVGS